MEKKSQEATCSLIDSTTTNLASGHNKSKLKKKKNCKTTWIFVLLCKGAIEKVKIKTEELQVETLLTKWQASTKVLKYEINIEKSQITKYFWIPNFNSFKIIHLNTAC